MGREQLGVQMKIYQGYPGLHSATWNWTVETAMHALCITCSGILDTFPRAIMLLGHVGEALPYVLKGIDDGWRGTPQSKRLHQPPSYSVKNNVMITTMSESLLCWHREIG